ncbi:MAG: response regulator transcription factor [Bifidobacteriaceae bacterium]|jgi:DNA-binding response OmpR family regulator|nr:response regulator transcription factor [Bifidobacteriaceae bacterium]
MTHILVVEDEDRIASFLVKGLEAAGYTVTRAVAGAEAVALAVAGGIDLMILDLGLPDMDGMAALQRLRRAGHTLPVIILTARSSVMDTVRGLEGGADDYLAKPVRFAELLARVKLRLRTPTADPDRSETLEAGPVRLELATRRAFLDSREVVLSAREFALAETLARHPGRVYTREQLLSLVWGYDHDPGSNVVDVYVGYLRKKLGFDSVETVRGMGYRWCPPRTGQAS